MKALSYMDDVVCICRSQADLNIVNLHVKIYFCISGMQVNWGKCQCNFGRQEVKVEGVGKKEEIKDLKC